MSNRVIGSGKEWVIFVNSCDLQNDGDIDILNFARTVDDLELFMYFSTDEIFGPAPNGI